MSGAYSIPGSFSPAFHPQEEREMTEIILRMILIGFFIVILD
jgi:hypothetical protein